MSPAGASQSEDQLYMDKLKQLSKYIEPLRRMINKIDKNEGTGDFFFFSPTWILKIMVYVWSLQIGRRI